MKQGDMLIFEKSKSGRRTGPLGQNPLVEQYKPKADLVRKEAAQLPEVAEVDVVRHYMGLSKKAFGVDDGFLPARFMHDEIQPKSE